MKGAIPSQPLVDHHAQGILITGQAGFERGGLRVVEDRKSTRLNSSHDQISYAVFCLKKKKNRLSDRIMPIPTSTLTTTVLNHMEPLLTRSSLIPRLFPHRLFGCIIVCLTHVCHTRV